MKTRTLWVWCLLALTGVVPLACGGEDEADGADGGRPDDGATGSICELPEECFPDVTEGELAGDAQCLDRVDGGYCTHECTVDEDCCAAEGECEENVNQVCSPFESTGQMLCFLSCEEEDIAAAQENWEDPPEDDGEYCQRGAGADFICRSSGGGAANRKVCVPGDCGIGADCAGDADCTGDLICATSLTGGYCTEGCEADADCGQDAACVEVAGQNICMTTCEAQSDCGFCRADAVAGSCEADVESVDGAMVSVCTVDER